MFCSGSAGLVKTHLCGFASRAPASTAPVTVYTRVLALLAALSQTKFAYGAAHVEANDKLYGHSPKFLEVVAETAETVLELALQALRAVQPEARRAPLAATLLETCVFSCVCVPLY